MKTLFNFLLVLFSIFTCSVFGQSLEAGYGNFGVFVYVTGEFPEPTARYEIVRSGPNPNSKERRWTLSLPVTSDAFRMNMSTVPSILKGLSSAHFQQSMDSLINLRKYGSLDKLVNFPDIQFGLGLAIRDTTVDLSSTYIY